MTSTSRYWATSGPGVRLLDVHPAEGEPIAVRLPDARPLFARAVDKELEFELSEPGPARLSARTSSTARRRKR